MAAKRTTFRAHLQVEELGERILPTHLIGIPHPPPVDVPSIKLPQLPTVSGVSEQAWAEAGRYGYIAAAKIMQDRNTNRPELTLSRIERQVLRKHFGGLVDRVSISWGAAPVNEWKLGTYKVSLGGAEADAQTYGYRIYVKSPRENLTDRSRLSLLHHELVHSEQYERFGKSLSDFGYEYFREYKRANKEYANNKLEVEASDRTAKVINSIVDEFNALKKPPTFCLVGVVGTLTIRNPTNKSLVYYIKWSHEATYVRYKLGANQLKTHYIDNKCGEVSRSPEIKFDSDSKKEGFQARRYALEYEDVLAGPKGPVSRGREYKLNISGNDINLYRI